MQSIVILRYVKKMIVLLELCADLFAEDVQPHLEIEVERPDDGASDPLWPLPAVYDV